MSRVSVIIPAREEPFLQQTIGDLLAHARGDLEIIAVLDGWMPEGWRFEQDRRVRVIHWPEPRGVRPAVNAAAQLAKGDYLMKIDAHCSISEGYDVNLAAACGPDEIVVPAKYSLNVETWERYREPWLYYYLTFPWDLTLNYPGLHDKNYGPEMNARRADGSQLDEIITYQGSCWFLAKRHFERIGPMDAERYYVAQEPQELGLKTWLGGGRVLIHKDVWYAHLFKGRTHKRGFPIWRNPWRGAIRASAEYWMGDRWPDRIYDMAWLVDRFWPFLHNAPEWAWPDDWQDPKYHAAMVADQAVKAEAARLKEEQKRAGQTA